MRIINRYVLKEILSHSLLGLLVFTFAIYIRHLGTVLELVVRHNLSYADVFLLFLLPFPGILVLTVPMAVLVGTLIGLSRMSADGEFIALRASGISLGQLVRPVLLFACLGWLLASWMSLDLSSRAARRLLEKENELKTTQVAYEIQPRVFLEQFPNLLVYLSDVKGERAEWHRVFVADTSQRDAPKVTLAERGILVNDPTANRLLVHLENGTTHEFDPRYPEQYSVVSFSRTDIPIPLTNGPAVASRRATPIVLSLRELLQTGKSPEERRAYLVELHYRFALPIACLALPLVGIPLGLSTRKGGKAVGFVLTILLVFIYYMVMALGWSLAKQGRIPPAVGLWLANSLFLLAGVWMIFHRRRLRMRVQFALEWFEELGRRITKWRRKRATSRQAAAGAAAPGQRLFLILDSYVLRGWLFYFALLLLTFVGIYLIFDFFQMLGDIVRNRIRPSVVFDYYRYLSPQIIYLLLPLSILVATLVGFGLLSKKNEITAMKSVGLSIYRVAMPVIGVAALLSVGMFLLADYYLPATNQRQDALRDRIKGKPPKTYYRPDRLWIFGQGNRIYNYQFFDPDQNVFANLSVFEFDARSFRLTRRIFASRAFWEGPIKGWIMVNGWARELEDDRVTNYLPFSVATFQELTEEPAYFKKDVKTSAQMNSWQLQRYINELRQSGFDVVRLSVQFYRKFSYPLIAVVVTLIGIPFAFTTGRRGALSGVAASIAIAMVYWSVSSLFEAMGNLSQLPPIVAAWSPDVLFGLAGLYLLLRVKT